MKVCIIAPSSIRYMPYLCYYEQVLKHANIEYDLYYWDRYNLDENIDNSFVYRSPGHLSGVSILTAYAGYRKFLLKHLIKTKYKIYIILTAQMGVLLYDFIRKLPIILDLRDYSHEKILPYRMVVYDLVKRARMVSISSRGFLKWLPHDIDYTISHNLSADAFDVNIDMFNADTKILSYIGAVSYYETNVRLLNIVGAMPELDIRYIGKGTDDERLKSYCSARNMRNVKFHGGFTPDQKIKFYNQTNFVIGCYGNDTLTVKTALPNRLYESCLYRRPIIVNNGTFLSETVATNGIGIVTNFNCTKELEQSINKYYDTSYYEHYSEQCNNFLSTVKTEMSLFTEKVFNTIIT